MPRTKKGRISLISMAHRFGSYMHRVKSTPPSRRTSSNKAYHELVVVELGETFSALGLARLSDVLEEGADSVWVLEVV